MSRRLKTLLVILTVGCIHGLSDAKVFYDIDFSASEHIAGKPPSVGASGESISKIVFGKPLVTQSQDVTKNQFLVFNTEGNEYDPIRSGGGDFFYDQIQLNMQGSAKFYYLSFDILTRKLINSKNVFTLFALQKISFQNDGQINIADEIEIPYNDSQQMLFEIQADLSKNTITYYIDKKEVYVSTGYYESSIDDIRFSLGLLYGDKQSDDQTFVGIDNIYVADRVPVEQDQFRKSQKVDQSQKKHDYLADIASDGRSGQTFVAGKDGRLIGIRLLVQGSGSQKHDSPIGSDIRVELRKIYPNGAIQPKVVAAGIGSKEGLDRQEARWMDVLFDRPYKQRADEKLAFTIKGLSGGGENGYNNYAFTRNDSYSEGQSFLSFSKSPLRPKKTDMAFETLVAGQDFSNEIVLGPTRNNLMSFSPPPPGEITKLIILWADGNVQLANEVSMKYAYNAKSMCWFDEVQLIIMGPSVKSFASDKKLQDSAKTLLAAGVQIQISKDTADLLGVSKELELFELTDVEHQLAQNIKEGWKVLTF